MPRDYEQSDRIKSLAKDLIKVHHQHLEQAAIAYVMKLAPDEDKPEKPPRAGKHVKAAKARTAPALWNAITGFDFVLEVDEVQWDKLDLPQQEALVDHELCHFARDEKGFYIRDHSVEEFTEILERHGAWHPGLEAFVLAYKEQPNLPFEGEQPTAVQ